MPQSLLPFEDFLTYLQQQGFALGVDDFLQIQTLLNRLPKDCPPEKLKPLMCPLVASNEEEQEYFYRAFDRYFADLKLQYAELEENVPPTIAPLQKTDEELEKYHKYGEDLEWSLKGFFYKKFQTIVVSIIVLLLVIGGSFVYFNLQKGERIEKRSVEEISDYDSNDNDTPNLQNPSKETPNATSTSPIASKEKPASPTTSKKDTPQKSQDEGIGFIEFVCWLLLVFSVWIFVLHFKVRRDFYLEALENIEPPHYWNIQVPKSDLNLARSQAFKQTANRLQKRRQIPTKKVDVPQTVEATIAAAGFTDFKYLQTSALPEYLLLIDQSSIKDQQTKWFDMWFEALKEREVMVHRFFFHGNPEWCWDAEQNYVSLVELQHRFGDCRLVVIAEGWQHSATLIEGDVFTDWQEKILLTTNSLSKSVAEYLEEESGFMVLPAKMESLNQLSNIFEGETPTVANASLYPTSISTDLEKLSVPEQVSELKRILTNVGFECLCAAAMYPEMNWDLTVFLGQTLFDERELLKEENMLPLVSLPYFRKGFMTEDLRKELTKELDGDSKRLVKGAILHLLKLHPLVEDEYSAEFFDYQLHIALQDAQLHEHDRHKLSPLKHLAEQKEFEKSRYKQVVLRYLETNEEGLTLDKVFEKWFDKKDEVEEKNIADRKSNNEIITYPRPSVFGRLAAMFADFVTICLFSFLVGGFWVLEFPNISNVFFTGIFMFLFWDCFSEGKVIGKDLIGLCLISLHNNKPAGIVPCFLRRCPDVVFLLFLFVGYQMGLHLELIYLLFFCGFFVNVAFFFSKDGRRIGDYLAGTQVVDKKEFEEYFALNPEKKPSSYSYSNANASNRFAAAFKDLRVLLGVFLIPILIIDFLFDKETVDFFMAIWSWLGICIICLIWGLMGLEKASVGLTVIDLNTRNRATSWKRIGRRIIDFIPFFALYPLSSWLDLEGRHILVLIVGIFVVNFVFASNHRGRRLGDFLLRTQVINVSDLKEGVIPTQKKSKRKEQPPVSEKYIYIYPNADNIKKRKAVYSGEIAMLVLCLVIVPIFCLLLIFIGISWKSIAGIAAFIVWVVWTTMDIWNQETNTDVSPKHLMIIDVKTNQPAKAWKMIVRRNVVIGLVAAIAGLVYLGGYGLLFVLVPIAIIQLMSSFLKQSERGLADSVLGIQLINVSDFEAKNYKLEEIGAKTNVQKKGEKTV